MKIPPASHPLWAELVTGKLNFTLTFLAAKIMLARVTKATELDPSTTVIYKAANDLRALYAAYPGLPKVKNDIELIFGM